MTLVFDGRYRAGRDPIDAVFGFGVASLGVVAVVGWCVHVLEDALGGGAGLWALTTTRLLAAAMFLSVVVLPARAHGSGARWLRTLTLAWSITVLLVSVHLAAVGFGGVPAVGLAPSDLAVELAHTNRLPNGPGLDEHRARRRASTPPSAGQAHPCRANLWRASAQAPGSRHSLPHLISEIVPGLQQKTLKRSCSTGADD